MISKQTSLDLNGPILSFVQQPQSASVCDSGSVTFVGIATALFPVQDPPNPATNTGTLSYRWYAEGFGPLTDGTFQGVSITGSGTTTLTIANAKSPIANGLRFYVGADYVPSAYSQPVGSEVTVGTGRSTGNAVNEILNSNTASLTVFPVLSVATQPTNQTAAQTRSATFTTLGALTDTTQGNISYRWQLNGSDLSDTSTITGSGTTALSIALPNTGINTVRARLTHPNSCNSPIFTNSVNFNVVDARQIITFEKHFSSIATIESINLFNGDYTLLPSSASTLMTFYAPEKDIDIEMDIYSAAGRDNGSFRGGGGGFSKVRFRMPRNVEYTIAGFNFGENPYIYKQSRMFIVVGAGGWAGPGGNGGPGGGVGVGGGNGFGRGAGTGGSLVSAGQLGQDGIFGSNAAAAASPRASFPNGGRATGCPFGEYWRNVGFSACTNMGNVQFRLANGTLVSNSAVISRGFKAGFGIRQTAGAGDSGAIGGTGATGGNGGTGGGGGGGGSGYHDGSIEVVQTTLGGNLEKSSRIIIRAIN
jgi:hypothetical protein